MEGERGRDLHKIHVVHGIGDRQTKLTHSPHPVMCYSGEVTGINCLTMDVTENK
jgi:hypothetical protein